MTRRRRDNLLDLFHRPPVRPEQEGHPSPHPGPQELNIAPSGIVHQKTLSSKTSNAGIKDMGTIKHHPAKLLALKMIAEFTPPRRILKSLSQYVSEGVITRAWVEKQSSEAKRSKWCRLIVYKHRREHLIETGCFIALESVEANARAHGLTGGSPECTESL